MAQIFYDHLIHWDKITQSLDTMGIEGEERLEIIEVIEESLHTEVLILILDNLPENIHEDFIERFHTRPDDPNHLHFISHYARSPIELSIHEHSEAFLDDIIADFLEA